MDYKFSHAFSTHKYKDIFLKIANFLPKIFNFFSIFYV